MQITQAPTLETCQHCRKARPPAELISTYWGGFLCKLSTKRRCVTATVAQLDSGECWPTAGTLTGSAVAAPGSGLSERPSICQNPAAHRPGSVALRRRWAKHRRRETEYVAAGRSLAASLDGIDVDTERVYVCGELATHSAELLPWATLPAGWDHDPSGHYLALPSPVFRLRRPDGRRVDVMRAESYYGDGVTPGEAAEAADLLGAELAGRFDGAQLLATPATTGRELVARSLPPGGFPVLDVEHQELIRSTSGQGRIQMLWQGGELPGLAEYDGRFMYAALCWGLGAGPAVHDDYPTWEPRARGRYRVRFTVPAGWDHVGLLGVADGDGWEYPTAGTHDTWADGAELLVAERHGWRFDVVERLLLADPKADPLRKWADRLVGAREAVEHDRARAGLRSILLHGLGAMHGRPSTTTRVTPVEQSDTIPAGADVHRVDGDHIVWSPDGAGATWEAMSHPEWTSAVWARARARLLAGPGGVGALSVPRAQLVAFRTDAIYVTGTQPTWDAADDGRAGRFRLVHHQTGPLPGVTTSAHLLAIKRRNAHT